ncbi:MAG: glycosyltransferase family 4 protein [Candidatus Zixiibacteriota bacterium]|nr:MAG: glycosyltransferase family 4 protein [candidate division Zixibacteria bacterium]
MSSSSRDLEVPIFILALKVLFLTHNYIRYPGDHAGGFLHPLVKRLLDKGAEVTVLAPHYPGRPCFEIIDRVKIYRFRYAPEKLERIAYIGEMHRMVLGNPVNFLLFLSFMLFFVFKGVQLTFTERIDVLSAQWWAPAGLASYVVSLLTGKRFVVTTHGTDVRLLSRSKTVRWIAGPVFRKATRVTAVSSFLKEELQRHLCLEAEKIQVLPMPPDAAKFQVRPLPQNETKVILNVSHFTQQKRLEVFMEACSRLKERGHRFKALCVGGGPLREKLERQVADLNLQDSVELREAVPSDEVASLYHNCDLCVLCSEEEGFGLTLVEAQLCGRPVVGTDSGGIRDIIEDGVNGLSVPVNQPEALADAIGKILGDPELASRLALQGAESSAKRFDPETLAALYHSILSRTAGEREQQ